jgi:tetratricopeptide (TPR) repeat protein
MRHLAIALLLLTACGGSDRRALMPGPETIGEAGPAQPYVVRMSDGVRDWEVEFPEGTNGYEMRIPLRGARAEGEIEDLPASLTDADRELLTEMRRDEPEMENEGVFRGGRDLVASEQAPAQRDRDEVSSEEPAPSRPSYLLGVSEVRRLYRTGNPEVAMIRLDRLIQAYPNDTRLLAMKGTLWLRLGRPELARRAYEEVLRRDPENRAVQQALRRLSTAEEVPSLDSEFPEPGSEE